MTQATCFDLLSKDIEDITKEEVDELLAELQARQRTLVQKGMPPDEANIQASKSVQDDLKRAAALEKRNAAINLRVRRAILDEINTSFSENVINGLESTLVGSKYSKQGARYGVDQIQEALKRKYLGGLVGDLERAQLLKHLSDGNLDLDIAKALHDLDDAAKIATLPKEAIQIATIIRKWQEVTRTDANKAGASIGKLSDYIVTQSHDADRLVNAGFEKWYQDILPRLDIDRMFPSAGPKDIREYLHEAYNGIISGIHEDIGGVDRMAGFKGPGNLAKRMSASRKLHFRDAEQWFEYNQQYGTGNLREALSVGLERMAESTGLMRKLGTNPENNFDTVVNDLRQRLRDAGETKKLKELDDWASTRGKGLYAVVSGKTRSVVNDSTAAIWGTVRGIQNITKLGGAVLSAVTDPFIAANSARHEGRNFFGALGDQLLAPFGALKGEARKSALRELDYASDGLIGQMSSRFSQQERLPGVMTKLQRWAFKLNLLQPHTDAQRAAAVMGISGHLARLGESAFDDLDDQMRRMLGNYGLTKKHWTALKAGIQTHDVYTVMSPQGVRALDPDKFAVIAKDQINAISPTAYNSIKAGTADPTVIRILEDAREDTATRLQSLIYDRMNYAVISPTARTTYLTTFGGASRGTLVGEGARTLMQFKSFSIAFWQNAIQQELYSRGATRWQAAGAREWAGMAQLMVMMTGLGYVSMTLKDWAKGKTARPVDSPSTWMAAAVQGGGAGIYGDFLFGEASRFGASPIETLAGPTAGDAAQLVEIAQSLRDLPSEDSDLQDAGAKALKFGVNHTPFLNLFYTKLALDHLFLYQMQENLNPGYLRRMERRVERDTGAEWNIRPTEALQ